MSEQRGGFVGIGSQDNPDNARHLGGECDNGLVRMHSVLQPVEPASEAIPCSIQMSEAGSRAMNEEFADVAVPAFADAEELLLSSGGVFPRNKAQPGSQITTNVFQTAIYIYIYIYIHMLY